MLFLLNEEGRLSHPNGIVFFNQSTDTRTGISMEDRGSDIVFSIDLERIRQDSALHSIVDSLLFVAVIDEKCSKTGRDLQVKEIIVLKDNAPEPKILEDEYEGFDENRTIFLSRFFITKEGRLGKEEIKKTKKKSPISDLSDFTDGSVSCLIGSNRASITGDTSITAQFGTGL